MRCGKCSCQIFSEVLRLRYITEYIALHCNAYYRDFYFITSVFIYLYSSQNCSVHRSPSSLSWTVSFILVGNAPSSPARLCDVLKKTHKKNSGPVQVRQGPPDCPGSVDGTRSRGGRRSGPGSRGHARRHAGTAVYSNSII